jgi:hypothetical protein
MKISVNNFDIIIIGAGISGCICALELRDDLSILLIDAGEEIDKRKCFWEITGECVQCTPCHLITGIGGCIKPGDSAKLSFPPSGRRLLEKNKNCKKIAKFLNKKYFNNSIAIQTKKKYKNFSLKKYQISIISSIESNIILRNIENTIKNQSNIVLKTCEKVKEINISDIFTIITEKSIYSSTRVIIATGRYGKNWLKELITEKKLEFEKSASLIGVRVQVPYELLIKPSKAHPDFKYSETFGKDKVKTFCFCGGVSGGVIKPINYDGIQFLDGHINTKTKNNKANFALLHTVSEEDTNRIIARYKKVNNGKIIKEKYSEFISTHSQLSQILTEEITKNIITVYEKLFNLFNEKNKYLINDTEVFGLEVENNWYEIKTNSTFEVDSISGLYVIGDALAIAQGLMQAAITGYIAAKGINDCIKKS